MDADSGEDKGNEQAEEAIAPPPPQPAPAPSPRDRVMLGPDGKPTVMPSLKQPPGWKQIPTRYLVIGGVILVGLVFSFLTNIGKTDAKDLKAGDCFELPSPGEFEKVEDQSCDGLHDSEIIAVISLPTGTPWPGANQSVSGGAAGATCDTALGELDLNFANIPQDAELGVFYADRAGWEDSDREVICYASSRVGLPGPIGNE